MSALHSTGHTRLGFQVRENHVGHTNNGESYDKSVANGQAAKKPALPLAFKSRYAMPSRLRRRLVVEEKIRTASLIKVATDCGPLLWRSWLGPVAVLCDEIQQRGIRDVSEKPNRNSGSASERSAERASIPAPARSVHIIKFNINPILRNTQRRLN